MTETQPTTEPRLLVIVIPAFNEAGTVAGTISSLRAVEPKLVALGIEMRIFLVDDGSTDDTGALARQAGADEVLRSRVNMGLGAAVRTGLMAARRAGADFAIKIDADGQHDPEDIPALLAPILENEADVVYGDRFKRLSYRMPFVRRTGNLVFTGLMRWMTRWPVRDSQPGIFALGRSYIEVFNLPGDYNYTQQILLDAYHKGMRFAQVEVAFHERSSGSSFVSLKYPFKVLPQILLVLVAVKPMKVFTPFGLVSLGLAATVFSVELGQWIFGDAAKPVEHVNLVLGLSTFGLQALFFGLIAELVVRTRSQN